MRTLIQCIRISCTNSYVMYALLINYLWAIFARLHVLLAISFLYFFLSLSIARSRSSKSSHTLIFLRADTSTARIAANIYYRFLNISFFKCTKWREKMTWNLLFFFFVFTSEMTFENIDVPNCKIVIKCVFIFSKAFVANTLLKILYIYIYL